jgi:hypothetical protein
VRDKVGFEANPSRDSIGYSYSRRDSGDRFVLRAARSTVNLFAAFIAFPLMAWKHPIQGALHIFHKEVEAGNT